jgi:hypothetical protein
MASRAADNVLILDAFCLELLVSLLDYGATMRVRMLQMTNTINRLRVSGGGGADEPAGGVICGWWRLCAVCGGCASP